jgi:HK97 family phage major capsid protein
MNPTIEDQIKQFTTDLTDIKGGFAQVKDLPTTIKSLENRVAINHETLEQIQHSLTTGYAAPTVRQPGTVSEGCATAIAAHLIQQYAKAGRLEALSSVPAQRDALMTFATNHLSITTRTALSTTDVPLPIQYAGEIRELISEYGVARRRMMRYPIGLGTAKPARMGARPAFSSIAINTGFPEKSPTINFASLESHKVGGIVRLPREIDEQSIVSMGHFLARYGAIEFARCEDDWAFKADGGVNYENVKGIIQVAKDATPSARTVVLAAGKTKPSDATLDDFRAVRRMVNKAALNGRLSAYYMDTTWETRLSAFKTQQEPNVYQRLPDGTAILDGYPIVWTDVLEPYGTAAAADKCLAVFGALSFWWMGEHGTPRIDTSDQVWFANDQLAVRFIEEIDFDYCAIDATAALLTAAS